MKFKYLLKEWVVPIGTAIILAVLINKFLFFQVRVPTPSMDPTIKIGDRIIVTRIYNKKSLKTGDIIVFYSDELKDTLIKRLIGVPGDTVEVKDNGEVYVNGKKINEPYVVNNGGIGGTFKVPEGKYFFMGDNRENSWDGRYWNEHYISQDKLKGKARFIIFPINRFEVFKIEK